jgi:hypothetical protein
MLKTDLNHIKMIKNNFKILSEETNRILELNSKLNKRIFLNESTPRDLTVTVVTVKDTKNITIVGAQVYDPDNSSAVNGTTDINGKVILKKFSGTTITVAFIGYEKLTKDIQESQNSVEVILKENITTDTVEIVDKKNVTIKVVDLKTKTPIKDIKVFITTKKNEKKEKSTDENGYFSFNYGTDLTTVSLDNGYTQQNFSLKLKEKEKIINSDEGVFKTIKFNNYIPVKLQLKDSETRELIPITEEILSDINVSVDDLTAFNKKLDIDDDSISDNIITLELNLSYISDSTKLIVKLSGFLPKSVGLTSIPTGPIVVTLTREPEPVKTGKLPKGIKLGMVYESEELYDVMQRWLGLCGTKYWEK